MKPTRLDVARHAGVSTATVSYIINNSRQVRASTREKVLKAIRELNYKPDMVARSMVTKKTKQLSVMVNDIINPFFGEIILGFENAAIDGGYFVNICTGHANLDNYFNHFISRRIDGVFITAIPSKFNQKKIYELVGSGIKVIMSGNAEADLKTVSSIENDYIDAMDQAVGHLAGLGHKKIAYLSGFSRAQSYDKKIEGYLQAINKYGVDTGDSLLIENTAPYETTMEDGYNLTRILLQSGKSFSAVISMNDLMAFGSIDSLNRSGINVPGDVSVMGFDDIYFSSAWKPALTTMAVHKSEFGAKAFEMLYNNIANNTTTFFSSKLDLVVRESTGPCTC